MAKIDKNSLGYLGFDYQVRLMAQILSDRIFANNIIEIVDPNYFEDEHLRLIAATIKDAKREDDIICDMGSLEIRLLENVTDDNVRRYVLAQLQKVKDANLNDTLKIQDIAMRFCKQQELKKSVKEIQKIIDTGNLERYEECEAILRKALEHGDSKDDGMDVLENIASVLEEDFRKPIRTGITGLDEVMDGGLSKGELAVILAPFGVGKALPNSNRLYTPNGYTTMGEIKTDDLVISRYGKSTNVLGVYPQGIRPIYKISFNDGTSTFCDGEHLWAVNSINQRNISSWKDSKRIKLPPDESFKVVKTFDMINNLTYGSKKVLNYKIPLVEPVVFNQKELSVDPYILGLLIGDGYMRESKISTIDTEIIENISLICGVDNISITERCRDVDKGDYLVKQCLTYVCLYNHKDKLKDLNLYDKTSVNKFIPKDYLYNSIENRVKLLQGLLDTDGTVNSRGGIEYTTVSELLGNDVRELVLSLGGFCKVKTKIPKYTYKGIKKNGKLAYTLNISFPEKYGIIPFKLSRKLEKVKNRVKYDDNKYIKSIEYSHDEEATCIMVDNSEQLYLTDDYIVTHNTTMMTKIANTGMMDGNKVLQIFFEDNPKVIQRKHLACWSEYDLNSLSLHKEELIEMCANMTSKSKDGKGVLKLKKFSSDGTTIPMIRQYIRKLIAQGFRPDLVLLDYIDCVVPSKHHDDANVGEGAVMRQFEGMLSELDIAGWTAVQGNRQSIGAEIVQADQMSGSIKKGMIGHFIVSIAKTLDQKEAGTATMAILKSRFGKDGLIFSDITFDNAKIQIDMGQNKGARTQTEHKKDVDVTSQKRVNSVMEAANARKALADGPTKPGEETLTI